jgi:hypothetical protein
MQMQGSLSRLSPERHAKMPGCHGPTKKRRLTLDRRSLTARAYSARDNPIPALLIGVGLVMLLTKGSGDKDGADLAGKAGDILKDAAMAGASTLKGAPLLSRSNRSACRRRRT